MQAKTTLSCGVIVSAAALAFMGWIAIAPEALLDMVGRSGSALGQHHLLTLTQATLMTGLTIAIVGALQIAADALSPHSEAVRKGSRQLAGPSGPPRPGRDLDIAEEGILAGRAYKTYADGTVEMNTLLGRREFESMAHAVAFLGSDAAHLRKAA